MTPPPPLPSRIDVAIVGAGVQGLSTALFLARAGRDVVVFERGDAWREASGVNAGSLAIQNKRLPLVPLAREALKQWASFQRELGDVGFVPSGGVKVAESKHDVVRLRESADQQRALFHARGHQLDRFCSATSCTNHCPRPDRRR